jgi:hypothetical protein
MVALTRSHATALEHILAVLLEQPTLVTGSAVPPFRACFLSAGVTTATDFVSITPDTYGGVEFSTNSDGSNATSKLNIIQIKKLGSLVRRCIPELAHTGSFSTCPRTSCCFLLRLCYFRISQGCEAQRFGL